MFNLLIKPLAIAGLALFLSLGLLPQSAGTDVQANVFTGAVITTTAQSDVVACGQTTGSIGRKTLVIENDAASDGEITVTVELRTSVDGTDFTSGYMANNGLAAGAITYTAKTQSDDIAARFCNVSAVSASTSTITVTLRKE
jgi:hypothetical protein